MYAIEKAIYNKQKNIIELPVVPDFELASDSFIKRITLPQKSNEDYEKNSSDEFVIFGDSIKSNNIPKQRQYEFKKFKKKLQTL